MIALQRLAVAILDRWPLPAPAIVAATPDEARAESESGGIVAVVERSVRITVILCDAAGDVTHRYAMTRSTLDDAVASATFRRDHAVASPLTLQAAWSGPSRTLGASATREAWTTVLRALGAMEDTCSS